MTRRRRVSQARRRRLTLSSAKLLVARLLVARLLGARLLANRLRVANPLKAGLLGSSLLGASLLGNGSLGTGLLGTGSVGTALEFLVADASADETTILSLPISSRLTAQQPGASLRLSTQRLPPPSDSDSSPGENRLPYGDFAKSMASTGSASTGAAAMGAAATGAGSTGVAATGAGSTGVAATGAASIGADSTGAASTGAASTGAASTGLAATGAAATELSTEAATDSPAISLASLPDSRALQASAAATSDDGRGGNPDRSVLRELPSPRPPTSEPAPSRLPPVDGFSAKPPPVRPVRLPPVESAGALPYGEYERSPVQVQGEAIPAPARSSGQLPPPYPSRLPPTGPTAGVPASTQRSADPPSTDWASSRWHRFKAQAQYDFWGYPEHFCERPMGLPNQMAYQAMVDNAREDLLVFHQYDFHDGQMEPAANLNMAGARRVDRVAELLSRQSGNSTVIVEFVPEQPRLTEARREEVAAQLGRYGLREPAVRVAIGRARRGITGREAQGIQRTFDRMTGASGLSGSTGGMNSMGSGMNSMGGGMGAGGMNGGGMGGGMYGGGMGVNQGSGMMGSGGGGGYGNSGAYGY